MVGIDRKPLVMIYEFTSGYRKFRDSEKERTRTKERSQSGKWNRKVDDRSYYAVRSVRYARKFERSLVYL